MTNQNNPYIDLLDHVVCNQCGADDFEVIYPPDYSNAKSEDLKNSFRSSGDELLLDQLVKCRVCGLQYLNPRIKQDVVLEAYSDGSDETFISQASARERTFASCLNTIEKNTSMRGKILDVGTAGGSFLSVAKQRGW